MNDPADEKHTALFATLVLQQSNMALLLMGRLPDPSTGRTHADLDKATLFIDMLGMLEARTRGNLSRDEERMLKETLTQLRMAFVEAAKAPAAPASSPEPASAPAPAPPAAAADTGATTPAGAGEAEPAGPVPTPGPDAGESGAESRKKFTKKY